MRLRLSTEDERFREEVRTWLVDNVPREPRPGDGQEMRAFDLEWQRRQYEGGWAGISWPKAYGGLELGLLQQMIWYEEYARCEAPHTGTSFVGLNFGGPTLIRCGSPELCKRHLGSILRGESIWCQGFSEPNAGSDLASLRTFGEVNSSEIVVTGQKIWTSYAHLADFQILLIRTDRGAKRHRGLTMVVCDMKTAGVDARPIQTMAGDRHFCEVFYDEVVIPKENVVGAIGEGWQVALTTLSFERGSAFMADQVALARKVARLIDLARERPGPEGHRRAIEDDEIGRELALLEAETAALRSMTYTSVSRTMESGMPGPEGSIIKHYYSELSQQLHRLAHRIIGADALAFQYGNSGWVRDYYYSYAATIGGGTSEIQREIIADRILNLPRTR